MAKTRKKLSREEKLAKDRLRKRENYAQIKNDPELYLLQKEKERSRYLARKEKKKICSIKDMTPRAQREQRRRWRKNSQKYLQKKAENIRLEKMLVENSPPPSDSGDFVNQEPLVLDPLILDEPAPNQSTSVQVTKSKKIIRRMRYKYFKTIKKLKDKINKLEKEKDALRKRSNAPLKVFDSIEKKVEEVLTDIRSERKEEIKKKLLFSESISKNLQDSYQTTTKKEKKIFADTIIKDDRRLRKYKLLHSLPFSRRKKNVTVSTKQIMINQIKSFFEEDTNSRFAAGKREFIKKTGEKKQKRYLTDNLKNLHAKFLREHYIISYSTFCKYRAFWVVFPKVDRDTCQCKLHSNVNYLIKSLKNAKIISESTGTDVINSLCCEAKRKCLEGTCKFCASKVLNYHEFQNDEKIIFYQWIVEKKPYTVKDKEQKIKIVTIKKKFEDYPRNVIQKLESVLITFLKHNLNIIVQYEAIKQLKQSLKDKEMIIHVDFSENYCLKYNQEIQSFHFGGSREQVSLHTGVLYYKDCDTGTLKTKSFCTISDCLQHGAGAIWAHICPILKMARTLAPYETLHFLSDSPSSQYRNKNIFYVITKLRDFNPNIRKVSWNYQESGHGKGAPDGIGAVVKRTADSFVRYGGDVGYFEDFWSLVTKNIPNVHFEIITENDINEKKIPPDVPGFKGTMHVHQVIWSADYNKTIALRKLSCFECENSSNPCIHNNHLGFLHFDNYGQMEEDASVIQCDQNNSINKNDNESMISLSTSAILNNLDESDIYKSLEFLRDPIDLQLMPLVNKTRHPTSIRSPKVKILSEEFEKFIQSNSSDKKDKGYIGYTRYDSDSDDYNIF
ncbi:unnamed protein product [Chilo suppressalis]|uniref:Uncharacterized protein n=1 Tax=Chilo suppressalis TaxID=168631 RepID=A0ABN8L0G3_CHISP|nr:unnamed protein product [Chilo suppressalis]